MNRIKSLLFMAVYTAMLFELFSILFVHASFWRGGVPTYDMSNAKSSFWKDINPVFGVWHEPGSTYEHVKPCFDVEYNANSYGARDVQREINGKENRTIVLGDSFVEGYGLPLNERLTNILEEKTGNEYLNFGTSGNFGPLQYYLLYKELASKFSHNNILIGVYPDNDFDDNNYELRHNFENRYRPYYKKNNGVYETVYYQNSLEELGKLHNSLVYHLKGFFREYFASYYVYTWFKSRILFLADNKGTVEIPSRFQDYSADELEAMQYYLKKIKELSAKKTDVTVFLIPNKYDLITYGRIKTSHLGDDMKKWGEENGIKIIDLLPIMWERTINNPSSIFHSCDGHWNKDGHKMAADIILSK